MRGSTASALLLSLLLFAVPDTAQAEAYSYVDENGRLHFTDSIHAVPKEFRARAEPVAEKAVEEEAGVVGGIASRRRSVTKWLLGSIGDVRQLQGIRGLTHSQKREFSGLVRTWLPITLIGLAGLACVTLAVTMHGLATGQHFWAIANLIFFGVPAGAYSFQHVAEGNAIIKFSVSMLAMAPLLALLGSGWILLPAVSSLLGR